jgi:hypothetical protein
VDFLIVPTLAFERLFVFVILGLGRRRLLWIGVTTNPTAEWLARQITEAFPWDTVPGFLIRDNDGAYGEAFTRRLRAMGIRDRPIAPRSPDMCPPAAATPNRIPEPDSYSCSSDCLHSIPRTDHPSRTRR